MKNRHKQKLVIISIIVFMLFNAPVLLLFNKAEGTFGLPLIYVYLFSVWLLLCVVSLIIIKKFDE